jgi:hypothetical protein
VTALKQKLRFETGVVDRRPTARLFNSWIHAAETAGGDVQRVLPLNLFEPADTRQMERLHGLLSREAAVVDYYLRTHVFPVCMRHRPVKLSACAQELGSSVLFGRRMGFSGTPNSLVPSELGMCHYESTTEGAVVATLTDPSRVTSEELPEWSVERLLLRVAADASLSALIDVGALVTGRCEWV